MSTSKIRIKGARVHNLKNIDLEIPKRQLVVLTGLSGSGKSSLAFDTIYAEGQRRYVESLSSYAKQFFGLLDKPDIDSMQGLSPTIAIDQTSIAKNPRSTVGTVTEIYELLRLLFSKIGIAHCPNGHGVMYKKSFDQIIETILEFPKDTDIVILSPIVVQKKGPFKALFKQLRSTSYQWVSIDETIYPMAALQQLNIDPKIAHTISLVIHDTQSEDDFSISLSHVDKKQVMDFVKSALDFSNGFVDIVNLDENTRQTYCEFYTCAVCDYHLPRIEPRNFSFNSPLGACQECSGLGMKHVVDPDLVMPNKSLSLAQGAVFPWSRASVKKWYMDILQAVANEYEFSLDDPVSELNQEVIDILLYGTGNKEYDVQGQKTFPGIIADLTMKLQKKDSEYMKKEMSKYLRTQICSVCEGKRLKTESLHITILDKSISDVSQMAGEDIFVFCKDVHKILKTSFQRQVGYPILEEMEKRLSHIEEAGLAYLSLDRPLDTLSGGERQRLRLAIQMSSVLCDVIYILDEPSVGLHQRDTRKLIDILQTLKNRGNSVIVVEHDQDIMRACDYIVDMGPGAGILGGKVIACGSLKDIMENNQSLTGKYLNGEKRIHYIKKQRKGNGKEIKIVKASSHNLKDIDVSIPLGKFVCVTGVSGSGKSSLIHDILAKALHKRLYRAKENPGVHKDIQGIEHIDKVITVDQSPIGRTPRSNPATYTSVFTAIRDLYTDLPESRIRGFDSGHFSFNVKGGGRCEACQGEGYVRIEMQFLSDVYVVCEQCSGKRYNREALEVFYKNKNIADILEMTVSQAKEFFDDQPLIKEKLQVLEDVGLGYIKLGQPATKLSGGEAQRVKLATELARRSTGKTLYILDEPTTGLHFEDINSLLQVLQRLVDKGNSVLVIEHNMDVIACCDYVIDLGPEGGPKGGYVIAKGAPHDIICVNNSYTGQCLKEHLEKNNYEIPS